MKQLLLMIIILTSANQWIFAQEIVTDRPDQTESSTTVPQNSLQIEMGFGAMNDKENMILLPTVLLRYGLMEGIEFRFGEQLTGLKNKSTSNTEFGLSDIELGVKLKLLEDKGINTEIAFITHIVVPTGSTELTNTNYGTINKLAVSHGINDFLNVGYNIGYNYLGIGNGDLTYSLVLGIRLSDKLGMYLETYGEHSDFKEFVSNFDSGFTYLLKENLQLDLSFGLGLTDIMNYLSIGFSWNINFENNNNHNRK